MFELRREQMKMQQESLEAKLRTGIKERQFFYPATFETLEAILRNNFTSVLNIGKKHALKKYDQFAHNTTCIWGSMYKIECGHFWPRSAGFLEA